MKQKSIDNIRINTEHVTQALSAIVIGVLFLLSVIMISMIIVHVSTAYAFDLGIGTSMEPTISTGDILIIDRSVPFSQIETGDIIHKHSDKNGDVYHRAQAFLGPNALYTDGDNKQVYDAVCVGPAPDCTGEYRGQVVYVIHTSELL